VPSMINRDTASTAWAARTSRLGLRTSPGTRQHQPRQTVHWGRPVATKHRRDRPYRRHPSSRPTPAAPNRSDRIDDDADLLALKGSWEALSGDHHVVAERECRFDVGVFGDGADHLPGADCSRDRWKCGGQASGSARSTV
jgi:hypothetical protein